MLKKWLTTTMNLFFPSFCLHCKVKIAANHLCPNCRNKIKILIPPHCYSQLKDKKNNTLKINSSSSYQGPVKDLIHFFKYHNYTHLSSTLAKLMIKQLNIIKFNPQKYDFITFIPLSPYKKKLRGYNQARLLAICIAKYFQLPLKDDIIISKYIKNSQTKLSSRKRKENVQGKFIVRKNLKNKNILLIDDVLTTGSTISACWQALSEKGASKIYSITLAK